MRLSSEREDKIRKFYFFRSEGYAKDIGDLLSEIDYLRVQLQLSEAELLKSREELEAIKANLLDLKLMS